MTPSPQNRLRRLLSALLPTLAFLALLEVASLTYYFQQRGPEVLGIQAAIQDLAQVLRRSAARRDAALVAELPTQREILTSLFSPEGQDLLQDFERQYEETFTEFARAVQAVDSKLLVLYVPPPFEDSLSVRVHEHDLHFFRRLAEDHGADFLDASPALTAQPEQWIYLLPQNFHLSRLGNRLLASTLGEHLNQAPYSRHRSSWSSDRQSTLVGDLPPKQRRVWEDDLRPFRVTTNGQGLRMGQDVESAKKRQRILLLGDSFTFGINLHDVDIWPNILQKQQRHREFVNAGVPGYTILQQNALFQERAKDLEPDITVLQVLFNDLYGFFYFERRLYGRDRSETAEPSELEEEFLRRLGVNL